MSVRPRLLGPVLALSFVLAAVPACGDDDAPPDAAGAGGVDPLSTTIAPARLDGDLPPVDAADARPLFEEAFAAHGVRLTDRGGLIDRSDGGYVKSAEGDHYALYVEPVGDRTVDQFVDGLVALTVATAPVLFERYPGLASYDICQEAPVEAEEGAYPPALTQVELHRSHVEATDWAAFGLDDLFALRDAGALVRVDATVADHPEVAPYID